MSYKYFHLYNIFFIYINIKYLTLGGPIIIPVQCVRVMSSSFSRPQLIVPSPTPFWPCSSSSKRRKFRGTTETRFITAYILTAEMIYVYIRVMMYVYTCLIQVMARGGHRAWLTSHTESLASDNTKT